MLHGVEWQELFCDIVKVPSKIKQSKGPGVVFWFSSCSPGTLTAIRWWCRKGSTCLLQWLLGIVTWRLLQGSSQHQALGGPAPLVSRAAHCQQSPSPSRANSGAGFHSVPQGSWCGVPWFRVPVTSCQCFQVQEPLDFRFQHISRFWHCDASGFSGECNATASGHVKRRLGYRQVSRTVPINWRQRQTEHFHDSAGHGRNGKWLLQALLRQP